MGVLVSHTYGTKTEVIHNIKPQISATSTEMVEEDVIEKANRELERINQELDAEETRLLNEQEVLDAQYASSSEVIQKRLEEIRETRTSF